MRATERGLNGMAGFLPMDDRGRRSAPERGVALLIAIWLTLAVSVLAMGAARETRTTVRIAANEVAAAQARAAAEAGIERMALALAAQSRGLAAAPPGQAAFGLSPSAAGAEAPVFDPRAPLRLDGALYRWRFGEATVLLSAQAERGKLDLNAGDDALLAPLLAAIGAPAPDRIAEEILAARGRDGRGGGVSWRLDPRPFESVADAAHLPSVSSELFARLAPLVTVASGRVEPDPGVAPDPLYRALPLSEDERRRIDARRALAPAAWTLAAPEVFTLRARAETQGGAAVEASALVEIDPESDRPIRVIARPAPRRAAASG